MKITVTIVSLILSISCFSQINLRIGQLPSGPGSSTTIAGSGLAKANDTLKLADSIRTRINTNQTNIATLIPVQTGNNGKYITTNGSALSWGVGTGTAQKQDSLNWYLPETYGAVGDGTTDDAPAFNAMMAAMPTNSTISLSGKTYALNSTWFVTKNVKIVGSGIGSIFKCGVNNIVMIKVSADYVTMKDFFMYNLNTPTSGCAIKIDSSVAHPNPIAKFTMDNIVINQFFNNVEAINAYGWTMTNCQINFVNYGVKISSAVVDAGDSHISGCTFAPRATFTGVAAIYQTNSGGLRVVNNKFNYNSSTKYQYAYYGSPMTGTGDLIIVGNSFENCTKSAIFLSVSPANTFVNTVISGNQFSNLTAGTRPDIQIEATRAISIQGNIFTKTIGCDTAILLTGVTSTNIHNSYDTYGVPVYYSGSNSSIYGDDVGAKYRVQSYSSNGLARGSATITDSANIASITTPTYGQIYPSNYMNSATGNAQLSFGSNLTGGVAGVELAFINSNIAANGFSFIQQTAVNTGTHIMRLKSNGYVGIGTANPLAILDLTSTTRGMLPPRMTSAQRDAITSKGTGETIYCTDCTATDASTGVMQTYNGSTWKNNW